MKTQYVSLSLLCALTMAHSEARARTLTVNNTTDTQFNLEYVSNVVDTPRMGEVKYAGFVLPREQKVVSLARDVECVVKITIEGYQVGTFKDQAAYLVPKVRCADVNVTIKAVNGRVVIEE